MVIHRKVEMNKWRNLGKVKVEVEGFELVQGTKNLGGGDNREA